MTEWATYLTPTHRRVGVRQTYYGTWITAYIDRETRKKGRIRCVQVPVAETPEEAQAALDAYARAHDWVSGGSQGDPRGD